MQHHEKMEYLTGQCLPTALHHLRAVGCDTMNPFTLALTAWEGSSPWKHQASDNSSKPCTSQRARYWGWNRMRQTCGQWISVMTIHLGR